MSRTPTVDQRAQERSIEHALVLDGLTIVAFATAAIAVGALTIIAELIRGSLMTVIEVFALIVMRNIHRGRVAFLEFGAGKLEQLVNLLIAGGMVIGAGWIALDVVHLVNAGEVTGTPAGFAASAILAAFNLYVNTVAFDGMRRAAATGGSVIMTGQLRARVVKLVSSVLIQIALTLAALSTDPVVIAWADGVGALCVCAFIVYTATGMFKAGLPDLIDQSVAEDYQAAINRMLAKHFDDYDRLDLVRTRRSGDTIYAEVAVAFPPNLTMADVDARIAAMKDTLRGDVGEIAVSIIASSS